MAEMGEERRKYPRVSLELIVRYKVLSASGQQDATTKNISAGGVCLVTREKMQPGTAVAMEIKFPKSKGPILAEGRVVWSAESKLGLSLAGHARFDNGIEFRQISDSDRQQIIDNVKAQTQEAKPKDWKIGIVTDITE